MKLGDRCARGSQLRPHIVWFGEAVPLMDDAIELMRTAEVFVVIGTSLNVYPAASLIDYAPAHARLFLIDPHPPAFDDQRVTVIAAGASEGVSELARRLA